MLDNNPDGGQTPEAYVLEDKLARIRAQATSKLENQKNLAIVLLAVEENIDEQHNDRTPVAYFVSFLSVLDQCVAEDRIVDAGLAASTAYFLDLVFPATPPALLRARFPEILAKLAPALTLPDAPAPLVRAAIGALETLLVAQDHQQWLRGLAQPALAVSPKRALVGLLELTFDPRPKVRRRAQDAVRAILLHPPPLPLATHVAAPLAAELALDRLQQLMKGRGAEGRDGAASPAVIHNLQLITAITAANAWPVHHLERVCDALLEVLRTLDQYLVSLAFNAFEGLFGSMLREINLDRFTAVLDVIFGLRPQVNDAHLAALWLAVIARALESFAQVAPRQCLERVPQVFPVVAQYLAAENRAIYVSAAQCLIAVVSHAVQDAMLASTDDADVALIDATAQYIGRYCQQELLLIKYQHATQEVLEFITATVLKLRGRANPHFLGAVKLVGGWRSNETALFPNAAAEDLLGAAIATMGPDVVLLVLPLNMDRAGKEVGRAWMLPLLRDNVRFARLAFFRSDILPLAEVYAAKIAQSGRQELLHNKIFQTIVDQVWLLLPPFCDLPRDLPAAFDDAFALQLLDLMYSHVELRGVICHALRLLVELNVAYAEGAMSDDVLMMREFPLSLAQQNVEILRAKAANVLLVLFNVFALTVPGSRNFVLDTIDAYLRVVPETDLEAAFNKVCGLLKLAMEEEADAAVAAAAAKKAGDARSRAKDAAAAAAAARDEMKLSATMLDLVVAMAKYVPAQCHHALFAILLTTVALPDALLQKRAYRIVTRMAETDAGRQLVLQHLGDIERVLVATTELTHTAARALRLVAVLAVVALLPATDLHFVPAILQEIIMLTKDVNEKTRELAYQILIAMGRKMDEYAGSVVDNSKVPGFDALTPPLTASLTEYFTMVSAGLAAQTPHMILATITAVLCLVFEFKDQLATETLVELLSTVELFLTHNLREIAKLAIGFVKVEVLSLPEELVRANMAELLAKLMRWLHEHKGHFKSKVKHILERLVRKFGIEAVEAAIPEDDRKLVANIKKTRARAKKRDAEDDGAATTKTTAFTSAYEEALYDLDDSDADADDEEPNPRGRSNQFIVESDEPLNLLDRQALASISSLKPRKFGKRDLAAKAQTRDGKLVFREDGGAEPLAAALGIDAYVDAIKQAPVRGQRNKLKYKHGRTEDDWSDGEDAPPKRDAAPGPRKPRGISKPKPKFKARKKL